MNAPITESKSALARWGDSFNKRVSTLETIRKVADTEIWARMAYALFFERFQGRTLAEFLKEQEAMMAGIGACMKSLPEDSEDVNSSCRSFLQTQAASSREYGKIEEALKTLSFKSVSVTLKNIRDKGSPDEGHSAFLALCKGRFDLAEYLLVQEKHVLPEAARLEADMRALRSAINEYIDAVMIGKSHLEKAVANHPA